MKPYQNEYNILNTYFKLRVFKSYYRLSLIVKIYSKQF